MGWKTAVLSAAASAAALLGVSQSAFSQGLPLVNQGAINPKSWVYGPRTADTSGGVIWNPVKQKMLDGQNVVGKTVSTSNLDLMNTTYCNQASAADGDFTWTEMQHSGIDWGDAWRMWAYGSSANCPNRRSVPGARVAMTDEREIQHALDGGAMVLVVPTVDSVEEAREVVQWAYFPPLGRRSSGGSQTGQVLSPWIPAGVNYRQTFNNNLVLIVMIETVEGARDAAKIAAVPGVTGVFAASADLGNFSGYSEGDADYEKLVTAIKDGTLGAGKRLCGPLRWNTRPGFTCSQNCVSAATRRPRAPPLCGRAARGADLRSARQACPARTRSGRPPWPPGRSADPPSAARPRGCACPCGSGAARRDAARRCTRRR
jgi:2-keto-3-deoxy-L-rhamnonate aldolase RhmA